MIKKSLDFFIVIVSICLGGFALVAQASTITGNLNTGLNSNAGSVDGTVVAAPTVSPTAGAYTSAQSVTLSATGSTAICYTTNGTTPSCTNATTCNVGTLYSGAISVNSSETIKSLACYNNNSAGPITTSTYAFSCSTASVSNGSVAAYPGCSITCNSGYTLSGSSCVAQSSGGSSGGGGGGSTAGTCTNVVYSNWNPVCSGNYQFRSIISSSPSGCSLTTAQQTAVQKNCQGISDIPTTISETLPITPSTSNILNDIASEAQIINTKDTAQLLAHLNNQPNLDMEQAGLIKYDVILNLDKTLTDQEEITINSFIVYGTRTTQRLGAGERAAVINSYFQAYGKLPNAETEWSDVLKIASGRWPVERSSKAESQAMEEFVRVYHRKANLNNNIDENAIMVIAYGLLPLQRNLNSEQTAIKTFRAIYGHAPVSALAWNIVRAIAYSGATR
ncbi:MAG: chitobiase/beta-hexosaminidase C-terminal domain-containing protein [Patescibacteria group bacterium]|nr:chitobiase/beta-hexosaminidase C-terminal domain-containing protein [Patescibacteria group bacterium]